MSFASFLFQVIMHKYTCTFRCITITLIKVLRNERFRQYLLISIDDETPSSKTNRQKLSSTAKQKIEKKWRFTKAKAGIVAA